MHSVIDSYDNMNYPKDEIPKSRITLQQKPCTDERGLSRNVIPPVISPGLSFIGLIKNNIAMKKLLIGLAFLAIPSVSFASFNQNLSYGMSGSDVYQLQDVLIDQGCLNHASTGYFGLITLNAVECYQAKNSIPNTGYVGILTRTSLNSIVAADTASSTAQSIAETGTTTASAPTDLQLLCPVGYNCSPVGHQIANPIESPVVNQPVVMGIPSSDQSVTVSIGDAQCHSDPGISGTTTPISYYPITINGTYGSFKESVVATDINGNIWNDENGQNTSIGQYPVNDSSPDYPSNYSFVFGGPARITKSFNFTFYDDAKAKGNIVGTGSGSVTFNYCQ